MNKSTFLTGLALVACLFLEESCSNCSRSGMQQNQREQHNQTQNPSGLQKIDEPAPTTPRTKWASREVIPMQVKENGICEITVEVNGFPLDFILDTGASSICISQTEAAFMVKQGRIDATDFIGKQQFSDAEGEVSVGSRIRLRSVKIGNRELENVEALVIENRVAPLLFGQTALSQFGKISIDYEKRQITFE